MEQFFTDSDNSVPQIAEYQPPAALAFNSQTQPAYGFQLQTNGTNNFDFAAQSNIHPQTTFTYNQSAENDFNEFEEDQTTKRIREDEERAQNLLRQKNQKEWNDKSERQTLGRKQLADFLAKKEQEKQERAQQNLQKQQQQRSQYNKLKVQQGWYKVISSINTRQGQHKGKKDVNRMREAILHRREDESGR